MGNFRVIQHRYRNGVHQPIPTLERESVRLIFNDPPYNIGVRYAEDETRDRLSPPEYVEFCRTVMQDQAPYLKPGGTFWWLCPASHMEFIPALLRQYIGPSLYRIVKMENFAQYQQKTLTEDYRMLFCNVKPADEAKGVEDWGKDLLVFNPDDIRVPSKRQELYNDKRADPRGRVPGQIWDIRRLQGTSVDRVDWHKAQLPPELLARIIHGWSNPGDLVLDGFAGSGSMGRVAQGSGRSWVGIEGSPTYCRKIEERLGLVLPSPAE